ncbi:MAG: hypothetical protein Q9217_003218 [Psora testacea]
MYLPIPLLLLIPPIISFALPAAPADKGAQYRDQQHIEAVSSFKAQTPIPTTALLAGILSEPRATTGRLKEQDYGDLGGEQPTIRASKDVWWLLGWKGSRTQRANEREVLEANMEGAVGWTEVKRDEDATVELKT